MTIVSRRAAPLLAIVLVLSPAGVRAAAGQTGTVRVEENFRVEPNGPIMGVLRPGTEVAVLGRRGGWSQVQLEGWMWIRSLQVSTEDGYDLVVIPEEAGAGHENLRTRPAGPVLARLSRGALLMEHERIPGWIRASRRGWVWTASLEVEAEAERDTGGAGSGGEDVAPSSDSVAAAAEPSGVADRAPAAGAPDRAMPGAAAARGALTVGPSGATILATPGGDTLVRAMAGADLELLERRDGWARVRVDGWVWLPDTTAGPGDADPASATPRAVATAPDAWRGRIVTWRLQFISLERAEAVRTDFYEGEPFLLTRALDEAEAPFVYVAVPPERLEEAQGLTPLESLTVVGRVRVGSSVLTGSPVLDLVDLRRGGGPGSGAPSRRDESRRP